MRAVAYVGMTCVDYTLGAGYGTRQTAHTLTFQLVHVL